MTGSNNGFVGVTVDDLLPYVRDGLTCREVAREFNRSRYALVMHLRKYGLSFMDLQVMVKQEEKNMGER